MILLLEYLDNIGHHDNKIGLRMMKDFIERSSKSAENVSHDAVDLGRGGVGSVDSSVDLFDGLDLFI